MSSSNFHALRQTGSAASPPSRPALSIYPPSSPMNESAVVPVGQGRDADGAVPYRTAGGVLRSLPRDFRQLEPTPELLAELAEASERLEAAQPEEIIAWANIDDVTVTTAYDVDKGDFWLGNAPAERVTNIRLKGGQLAVLYPTDAHAPRRAAGASAPVRKLVVKVAI